MLLFKWTLLKTLLLKCKTKFKQLIGTINKSLSSLHIFDLVGKKERNMRRLVMNWTMERWQFSFIDILMKQIKAVSIFGSQFKQRYLFTNQTFMEEQYNANVSWSFLATSHGKGAVDGIGGTVKRLVWSNILAGKLITAKDFVEIANQNSSYIFPQRI
ncbi:hypothetical protein AVEN_108071-1 [Araneus ventricosus]|uniref:Uncharacterized protein n=1 Tax=Araneus ventricosus TaxID=182803 RepID=A0A4Y2KBM8_ARAVE|nr:hypothetical protein AVEN_108071-1 [Araneus ventricosus]